MTSPHQLAAYVDTVFVTLDEQQETAARDLGLVIA